MTPSNLGQFLQVELLMAVRHKFNNSCVRHSEYTSIAYIPSMHKGIKDNEPILVSGLIMKAEFILVCRIYQYHA